MPGFIPGSRGTLMMDVVACSMFIIIPFLLFSIHRKRKYNDLRAHRRINTALGFILLVAVILFELEVRFIGWRHVAKASAYYDSLVFPVLYVHLIFAISTSILWIWTFVHIKTKLKPANNMVRNITHKRLGYATAITTSVTGITGWIFYTLAFIL